MDDVASSVERKAQIKLMMTPAVYSYQLLSTMYHDVVTAKILDHRCRYHFRLRRRRSLFAFPHCLIVFARCHSLILGYITTAFKERGASCYCGNKTKLYLLLDSSGSRDDGSNGMKSSRQTQAIHYTLRLIIILLGLGVGDWLGKDAEGMG